MPVDLASTTQGESGPPLLILHGMLGSSRNWTTIAREFAARHRVHCLDLRNHGASPHTGAFTYDDLVGDVVRWLDAHVDEPLTLIGHSLGGKAAMLLACRYPAKVRRLVVVDASPCAVPPRWETEFRAMLSFDPATLKDRREAEAILQREGVDDWALRKFLLSNMDRAEGGGFRWKINLHAIHDSLPAIFGPVLGEADRYDGSVLLIRGGDSRFVPDEDFPVLRAHFPALRLITIHEAGHNVHADAPEAFLKAVLGAQD